MRALRATNRAQRILWRIIISRKRSGPEQNPLVRNLVSPYRIRNRMGPVSKFQLLRLRRS